MKIAIDEGFLDRFKRILEPFYNLDAPHFWKDE